MALSSHQSARMKNDEWLTPPEILAALGSFDLDSCAPVNRPWATAARHYTVADNGLAMPWHGRKGGRKPAMSSADTRKAAAMLSDPAITKTEVAKHFKVSRVTLNAALAREGFAEDLGTKPEPAP